MTLIRISIHCVATCSRCRPSRGSRQDPITSEEISGITWLVQIRKLPSDLWRSLILRLHPKCSQVFVPESHPLFFDGKILHRHGNVITSSELTCPAAAHDIQTCLSIEENRAIRILSDVMPSIQEFVKGKLVSDVTKQMNSIQLA
jgi:hypothetical protein